MPEKTLWLFWSALACTHLLAGSVKRINRKYSVDISRLCSIIVHMRIAATSDLHGILPSHPPMHYDNDTLAVHDFDVLIVAGDVAPNIWQSLKQEKEWTKRNFYPWLEIVPAKHKIFIAGNHDLYWEHKTQQEIQAILPPNCHYLYDSGVSIDGIYFYGTPWQPVFMRWAFNRSHEEQARKFAMIPERTDVLITHCPPYGFGDIDKATKCNHPRSNPHEHLGSLALRNAILDKKPRYNVFGHIHSGGHKPYEHQIENQVVTMVNVSYINESYDPEYPFFTFEIEPVKYDNK